jgi:hypothetical protein
MSDWGVGYAMGIASGLAIGFAPFRKRTSWPELSEKERKLGVRLVAIGVGALAAAAVVFFLVR